MTAVIILNWNGFKDTIACLSSLYNILYNDFFIVLVDNGSTNQSVEEIKKWLDQNEKSYRIKEENDPLIETIKPKECVFLTLKENYGFAKGNNKGVEYVQKLNPSFYLCLNNDTEVEPDFLTILHDFYKLNPEYKALTPLICYFDNKEKVWNAGGKTFFGLRKYYYENKNIKDIKEKEKINISFVTGCALFFQKDLVINHKIFTEKFFFGEEDFDFSLRMKKQKNKMACVIQSLIYHKVSSSIDNIDKKGKIYLYYINRFINMKLNMNTVCYFLWKYLYFFYLLYILRKINMESHEIKFFIKNLYKESRLYNHVDRNYFLEIMNRYK